MVSNHILLLIMHNIDMSSSISLGSETAISTLDFVRDEAFYNHFYVGFVDGMVRKMNADLSSGLTFQAVEQVDKFYNHYMLINHTLTNGTVNQISNFYVAALSCNKTTLKLYTANNFTQVFSYIHNQTILLYSGNPINYGSTVASVHLLAGNQTIRLIYKAFSKAIVNFTEDLGAGVFCKSVAILNVGLSTSGDNLTISYAIYAHASNNYNRKIQINLYFTLNGTTATYDMSAPYIYSQTHSVMPESIARTFKYNQIILLQASSNGKIYALNNTPASNTIVIDSTIPKDVIVSLFAVDIYQYLLTEKQLLSVFSYQSSATTTTYTLVTAISNFPANTFVHTFGSYFDLLLIPFTNNVYLARRCDPQKWFDGTSCVAFTCKDPHCSACYQLPNICTTCTDNYSLTTDKSCASTEVSNSTIQTNDNTTNSTMESIPNSTFPFIPFNPFSNNASFNMFLGLLQSTWTKKIYQKSKQTAMLAIAIPAARRIASPLFYYFGNFDDLFLYSFHNRTYGETMKFVFGEINQIQAKKWSIINYQTIVDFFGNSSEFDSFINYQSPYLSATRSFTDGESHDSLSLVASCTNFFVVSAPITLVAFFALSLVFRLLFRFRVSQFLRKFDFVGFLFVLLFDGNIQQFAFFLGFEWREAFSFSFSTKLLKSSIIVFGFAVVSLSVCGYFVCYAFYRKLNKYIMDNNKNSLSGIFFLLFQNGLRNLVLGMAHSLLRDENYETLISSLYSIEVVSFGLFIYSANNLNYQKLYAIWIYIFMTFIRLFLILTFFLDFENVNVDLIENTQTGIVLLMIIIYFGSIIVGVFGLIIEIIDKIIKLVQLKKLSKQEKMQNSIQLSLQRKRALSKTMLKRAEESVERKKFKFKERKINPRYPILQKNKIVIIMKQVSVGRNKMI